QVADLDPELRTRYFAEHDIDESTRHEVEALLKFDSGASEFLLHDISIAAARALPQLEGKGWRCGPYRLLDLIGRGGMGAVYLAERADGEVTQQVAVKLLPPGAGDPQRERFLQERQILASLAHPNIARMLDAGHLDNGQPFLAMEYVDGKPIDVFAANLSVREKIALFQKVCAAVAYLHRNLVVHRDLKPSNILVTAEGDPKLLDFGIAKILDLATDSTMTGMRMLTPDYASPEQVTGGRVSTATDIYSLGAVLYRLLTGKPAHEFEDHSPEAIAQVVTGREVTRPSRWSPELKGDLEFILLKALRKDPQERYATVEQFAEDLQAFLESRTVRARSGNAWYRTRKFVRRYWVTVTAAAVVIASLSVGLYVANRQRMIAEHRFSQLRQLAHQVIFDLEAELAGLPGAINARKKLVATATQYLAGLGADASNDKDLAQEVAQSYMHVARIQGVPAWNNLGEYAEAEESLRKADRLLDSVLAADPHNRNALWLSANVAHDRATAADAAGWPEQVVASAAKARERFDELVRLGNLTRKEINGATYIYGDLAEHHIRLHRFEDAARYARLGAEISRTNSTVSGPRAQVFSMLASALMDLGDVQGALDAIQEARSEGAKLVHEQGEPRYSRGILALVGLHEGLIWGEDGGVNLDRPLEAAARFRQVFDPLEELARNEPKDYQIRNMLAEVGRDLGDVLRHNDRKQALEVYDHTLIRIREVPNDVTARRYEALLLAGSSYPARWIHRESDARDRIDAAFRLLRETKDYPVETIKPGSEADTTARALADHYAETGQTNEALEAYQELRRKIMASTPDPQNDLLNAAHISRLDASLAALLRRVGRTSEAVTLEESRLELWRHWNRKLPNNPFVLRQIAAQPAG
ncbi:MAG TPA: protein kinase, partial [Bryobacteraceae bacterium]|nr:protein kinase [Bryobacteraceae bacterium]